MVERDPGTDEVVRRPSDGADPLVGKLLADRFRILDLVARGGMGKIYKAEQLPLGRTVALKILAPTDRGSEDEDAFRRRFEREASICARLTHSNTVRIFDFGRSNDGIYYIAMEWIEGRTLHQIVKHEAPLHPGRVIHIIRQIAASLYEAHQQGIVHRDLKPGNVLITTQNDDRDFVKVVDFGLVKHMQDKDVTQAGLIVGSPMYMSPEQVRGEEVDHRTDIYALGMITYVSLTGKRPFDRDTPIGVMMARMSAKPPPMKELAPDVTVPPSLEWAVMTALETQKADRFETMHEVLRALKVCEAEVRGDQGGPFKLGLDNGKTVLPPDFSDLSLVSRSRTGPVHTQPDPTSSMTTARKAGLSIVAMAAVGAFVLAAVVALVGIGWLASREPRGAAAVTGVETPIEGAEPGPGTEAAAEPAPEEPPPVEPSEPAPEAGAEAKPPEGVAAEAPPEPEPVVEAPKPAPKPKASKPKTTTAKPAEPKTEPAPAETTPTDEEEEGWKVKSDIRNPFGD